MIYCMNLDLECLLLETWKNGMSLDYKLEEAWLLITTKILEIFTRSG